MKRCYEEYITIDMESDHIDPLGHYINRHFHQRIPNAHRYLQSRYVREQNRERMEEEEKRKRRVEQLMADEDEGEVGEEEEEEDELSLLNYSGSSGNSSTSNNSNSNSNIRSSSANNNNSNNSSYSQSDSSMESSAAASFYEDDGYDIPADSYSQSLPPFSFLSPIRKSRSLTNSNNNNNNSSSQDDIYGSSPVRASLRASRDYIPEPGRAPFSILVGTYLPY